MLIERRAQGPSPASAERSGEIDVLSPQREGYVLLLIDNLIKIHLPRLIRLVPSSQHRFLLSSAPITASLEVHGPRSESGRPPVFLFIFFFVGGSESKKINDGSLGEYCWLNKQEQLNGTTRYQTFFFHSSLH